MKAAFTRTELLIVIGILSVLCILYLPTIAKHHAKVSRIACVNQLKQIGLAFRIFSTDHEVFPMQLSTNLGGTAEWLLASSQIYRHFQILSNELSVPKVVVCPQESRTMEATNFQNDIDRIGNRAISYFIGINATQNKPNSILCGDRDLVDERFGLPTRDSLIVNLGTEHSKKAGTSWGTRIHESFGNITFVDGSVSKLTTSELRKALIRSSDTDNRLGIP